ncbi:MAG TPA: hypothetical protein VLA72_01760 [Anaerolineales bacterium]|nr:hypothetical protein [Anaerolineales bacterium]
MDSGEPALPDVLIAACSNIHGTMTYTAQLTDTAGKTNINATYTRFFDLLAFPPCGYEATTPGLTKAGRKIRFGFAPVNPNLGNADFYILLWHDENLDGEYQSGEMPIAGEILYIDPGLPLGYDADIPLGQLLAQTDSGGEAETDLGCSCGEVKIKILQGWYLPGTPDVGQYFTTTYQLGHTTIYLGVIPDE